MQAPGPESPLGPFPAGPPAGDAALPRFFTRAGTPTVRATGPDGAPGDFPVRFAFGVEPLQQLLLELPDGRLQAFDVAWDARPESDGGQRWFPVRPEGELPPDDPLHWTGLAQSWESMCADCHSTGLRRRWDPAALRTEIAFEEEDVSCEACHGPGSRHVAWAEARRGGAAGPEPTPDDASVPGPETRGLSVALRNEARWVFAPGAAIAHRVPARPPDDPRRELATCAPCHSRRSRIAPAPEPGEPFLDGYRPALLDEGLYHPDGQILDEVYVWGSFVQSAMHRAGVTCSDCHDPHSLGIEEPDAACATCHRSEVFAARSHHGHDPAGAGGSCVACHMPARVYMGVDARRDHSFRVPRPDLSLALGTPNACQSCHTGWSERRLVRAARGLGEGRRPGTAHYGEAIAAGRRGSADGALVGLARDESAPGIARATALSLLRDPLRDPARGVVTRALADPDPLVRLAAAEAASRTGPGVRLAWLRPLLEDPRRAVRIGVARLLVEVPPSRWPPGSRVALADGLAEYRAARESQLDRPESHVNLGALAQILGEPGIARQAYETALRLGPWFVPASVRLADLHRARGDEAAAEAVLREALARTPEVPDLHHVLGLALVRQGRLGEALPHLEQAAVEAPGSPRFAFAHAFAVQETGDTARALALLERARERHPEDRDLLFGLATLARDAGDRELALRHARTLLALAPQDPRARRLVQGLERPSPER